MLTTQLKLPTGNLGKCIFLVVFYGTRSADYSSACVIWRYMSDFDLLNIATLPWGGFLGVFGYDAATKKTKKRRIRELTEFA